MIVTEYELLVCLAEELNMRKSAEKLFLSQPALSQRLQTIESRWNTKIFIRTQKGLLLTPEGEAIVRHAASVIEREHTIQEKLEAMEGVVRGTLRIACASVVAQMWLPRVLKTFTSTYPNVQISLVTGWSSEVTQQLAAGNVHIGIVRGNSTWKSVQKPLFNDKLILVDTEITKIEEVFQTNRPFVQFRSDSNYYQVIQDYWQRNFGKMPRQAMLMDQMETSRQMALNGIGFAILPEVTMSGYSDKINKIPLIEKDGSILSRETNLLTYEQSLGLPQVKAFLEIIDKFLEQVK
ncbi:LysR family transcriptional regulator [Listeria ivanovii]|uniref:LysR family transcriptional regulator n=2 Tax=Listeria ivanovii TaxID=1638 RepID=A0ABS1G1E6_LISIV|nr:LysR family transcriptional regulator [Listeria ivanovii]EFR97431.1 LyrA transcriptional regulatory protein [Listeria ivanovii FSL F6-596]AIS59434.1 LysR family transcriptional regulator [Listeria ivanovii subsp. londoniensis]AIS62264.1 LysR family transcriptional regulator [Listeria ivanovii subsp. londoniensis]MBC2255747.1 LysR family transcriptional regulator [Listeria ivanovii]MBK1960699.1 LysR family transcriptional regulator [Listeria ivanovii subsp. londoniensis]